ncbi:hypothetical protein [Terrabacter sp. GCM10028922]|uniref:hypothetical protein n=1 Tax=Terrabacter sp. GCM10028922 TaxID=3273428 RepID=UPI0036D8CEFE
MGEFIRDRETDETKFLAFVNAIDGVSVGKITLAYGGRQVLVLNCLGPEVWREGDRYH